MSKSNSNLIDKTGFQLKTETFGEINGEEIDLYSIRFESGLQASLLNYGGIIQSLYVPDKSNKLRNIVEGFNSIDDYVSDQKYTGAIIGRYANRIKNGAFSLDGKIFQLTQNQMHNHLHGGINGFHNVVWKCKSINKSADKICITLSHYSPDGTEGYPGNVEIFAKFSFTINSIQIEYSASSDEDTILNMTHHSYFNLNGIETQSIKNHQVQINASQYFEVDKEGIPISKLDLQNQTTFDFSTLKSMELRLKQLTEDTQLRNYDHCFILSGRQPNAKIFSPKTGIKMEIISNQKGMQFYNVVQNQHSESIYPTFCLEPQYYPNAPNSQDLEGAILRQGDTYRFNTTYQFSII